MEENDIDAAKKTYEQIEKLYQEMPEYTRKRFYLEMRRMHKSLQQALFQSQETDVRRLLTRAIKNLDDKQLTESAKAYDDAQKAYEELPAEMQKKIYAKIRVVYDRINHT